MFRLLCLSILLLGVLSYDAHGSILSSTGMDAMFTFQRVEFAVRGMFQMGKYNRILYAFNSYHWTCKFE